MVAGTLFLVVHDGVLVLAAVAGRVALAAGSAGFLWELREVDVRHRSRTAVPPTGPASGRSSLVSKRLKSTPTRRLTLMGPRELFFVALVSAATVAVPAAAQGEGAAAQATGVQVDAGPFDGPIEPLSETGNATVVVSVSCGSLAEGGSRQIHVAVDSAPSWSATEVQPGNVTVSAADCDGTNGTAQARTWLEANLTAEAPAFTPTDVTVRAASDGMEPGTGNASLEAAFYAVLDAQTDRPVVVAEPQSQLDFTVEVTNFGNGPVEVTPTIASKSAGLGAVLPPAFTVGSNATGNDNRRSVVVSVQTPFQNGYTNQDDRLEIRWSARYAEDSEAGGTNATTQFTVQTKGFHVPAPGPAAVVGALAGAALVAWRVRGADGRR